MSLPQQARQEFKIEFKPYGLEYAGAFAQMRNNHQVLNNGYDKTPNPFTKQDATDYPIISSTKNSRKDFLYFTKINWQAK